MTTVYVAGHKGMVGSAICRLIEKKSDIVLLTSDRKELDLSVQSEVRSFFEQENPDEVILAAAKVGGIQANSEYPAEFIYQNLMIECNIIHEAYRAGVKKLLFLGSSCIYPKFAEQPIKESALLNGGLEPTNEPYAIAKIAGVKLCESYNRQYGVDYRSVMPTNLYGQGDNFHPENSHVIPAMIQRFHKAKLDSDTQAVIWGTGKPKREFLHVDDMAEASWFVHCLEQSSYQSKAKQRQAHINVGTGVDCSIRELAETIKKVTGFKGNLVFDTSKPDGTPKKLLDVSLLGDLGWEYKTDLEEGLEQTYQWFLANQEQYRR